MILPGKIAFERGLLSGLRCARTQVQPCGIDLSLKRVLGLQSPASIDFDNTRRRTAASTPLQFEPCNVQQGDAPLDKQHADSADAEMHALNLAKGIYLVEFNEIVKMPLDVMGQLFVRSSLFRSGAQIHAGVVDSGYEGVLGAMLGVENAAGIRLYRNARLAQIVFSIMTEPTDGYSGQYQGRGKM